MIIRLFEFKPVDRQGNWLEELNSKIRNAVHVDIYLIPADNQGEDEKTIKIVAMWRDKFSVDV